MEDVQKKDTKNITILIAGRPYPLKINASDEPAIRKIVKEVNEKVNHFQLTYTNKDKQDCLSMALLTYAVDLHKSSLPNRENTVLAEKLAHLEALMDDMLAE
ncbi:MAG TPA: cell division protein ZapA [Saprospiraceae bacterium]|nr:cell division protein ZapA [Saprospiraceae bacterium]HMQ85231.1 cell division protein ZapA [Saprospiraceae bacterium]